MILQSLVSYYEALAATDAVPQPGWGKVRVRYALELDDAGQLLAVLPLESVNEKGKPTPRYYRLPMPQNRTAGVASNFLWDNAAYLLGLDGKGKPERALKCFEDAKALHLTLLGGVDDPFARAICGFFNSWLPAQANDEPKLADYLEELAGGANLAFLYRDTMPGDAPALQRVWQRSYDSEEAAGQNAVMRCLVTGEPVVPQLTHPSIMKVNGAQSSGAALVSFNAPAFCSYDREQNCNAPVGKYAAFAYTTALNELVSNPRCYKRIGSTTLVYWAENAEPQYQDMFGCSIEGSTVTNDDLSGVMDALANGRSVKWDELPVKPDNRFYVLGLAPNAARLSVRFFLRDTFGSFAANLKEHYKRLKIVRPEYDKEELLPLWKLLRETTNPNSRDKAPSPQMAGDTLRAILTDSRYPATLYQQTLMRIHAEHEVTRGKAAIIKAYLLQNMNDTLNKEALSVKLNETTSYQPYILGRMFSVLEAIQQRANPGINTTIKDKYFTSACATPAVVFPTLLNLSEKHLRKMDTGAAVFYSKQLRELLSMITESYPVHLTLYDQGIFQLGYYHQTQKRFTKNTVENNEEGKENV